MKPIRVALTAGFGRSPHVVALAEMLMRQGHTVAVIVVASPWNLRRLRMLARTRERGFAARAIGRAIGFKRWAARGSVFADFLEQRGIRTQSLRRWARRHHAVYRQVSDLNSSRTIRLLTALEVEGVLYGGGGILRRAFIDAVGGRILNAHAGPLPAVRGMNACEWSLLFGLPPTVTIHWIDAGIDTGPTLAHVPVPVSPGDDLAALRERAVVVGVEALCRHVSALRTPPAAPLPPPHPSRQCYVLAPALRELAEARLHARLGYTLGH